MHSIDLQRHVPRLPCGRLISNRGRVPPLRHAAHFCCQPANLHLVLAVLYPPVHTQAGHGIWPMACTCVVDAHPYTCATHSCPVHLPAMAAPGITDACPSCLCLPRHAQPLQCSKHVSLQGEYSGQGGHGLHGHREAFGGGKHVAALRL